MVKHAQTIRQQVADKLLSAFDHFVGLALKGLILYDSYFYILKLLHMIV